MSTEATPDAGSERRFTEADLKLLAYIYQQTQRGGQTHDKVLARLAAGELDNFEWEMPVGPTSAPVDAESYSTALVPIKRLQAAQALLQAQTEERQRLLDEQKTMQHEIGELRQALGHAQGELAAYKAMQQATPLPERPKSWWTRLFGGNG
jgi:hypothetical protein